MELTLIILCGILFGAFNFGFFCLGYYICTKQPQEDVIKINDKNKKAFKQINDWANYQGIK